MRIDGIWRYHMRTSWRSLTLIGVIVLVLFMAVLVFMSPYMAETLSEAVHLGTDEVVVTRTELNKPMLTSPFGTNGFIYAVYMIVYTITSMMSDRRYLLSNNVTRYEFMIGSYLSAATMAGLLVCMQYVIDLICRIATYFYGIPNRRHGMDSAIDTVFDRGLPALARCADRQSYRRVGHMDADRTAVCALEEAVHRTVRAGDAAACDAGKFPAR